MDPFVNGCRGRAAAIRREAQRRLDDLVSKPWHANSKVTEDISRVRHQIDILKASNELSSAELLDIAHPCDVCDAAASPATTCTACTHGAAQGTTHKSCAVCLATGLMRNLDDKKAKMHTITDQIHNRSALIRKFEDHLKTYENISKSLNIVAPEDKLEYFYKIDTRRGVNLVINERKNSSSTKDEARFFKASDLVDPETLIPPPTPVLKPPEFISKETPHDIPKVETADSEPEQEPKSLLKPRTPILQIWDTEEERVRCLRENTGSSGPLNPDFVPLIFKHGIQYKPHDLSSGSISPTSYPTDCSRMVVLSNVHTETTWEELLTAVRGGPILRVTRADLTTWFVFFVRGRDAQAYTDATRTRHTVVHGQIVCVALAPTPSYPVRAALMQDIAQRGVTRCLGFPWYDAVFGRMLETCLLQRKIGDFVVSKQVGIEMPALITPFAVTSAADGAAAVTTSTSASSNTSSTNASSASVVARRGSSEKEEWIVLEDEQCTARFKKVENQKNNAEQSQRQEQEQEQQVTPPTPTKMNIVHFAFRDIVHAQAAYRAVCAEFPSCGVFYAPDPCAGPLSELA
ncbi:hypothetical protein F5Y01DRAFT_324317 [Xylaria sp. FL0043]|nr:hypothetical protein F5Y01DRAFT_324317 [Xylaria sp. FL0043]